MERSSGSTGTRGASSAGAEGGPLPGRSWIRVLAVAGGATLVALFFTLQKFVGDLVFGRPPVLLRSLGTELLYWYLLAAALPAVLWFARRFRIERGSRARTIPVHVGLALGLGVVHSIVYYAALALLLSPAGAPVDWAAVARRVPTATLTVFWKYAVAVGLFYAWDYYRKYREREVRAAHLERRLSEARLQALRGQLQPHFLFNTLHTASMLAREDPEGTGRVLTRLADLLRATLDKGTGHEVPLATELSFVRRYLEIEQVRFGDRLSVDWDVPDELLDARVPTLLIQPLVENAVRHGVGPAPGARCVGIRVRARDAALVVEVRDDGPGLPEGWSLDEDAGVGLANTRSRLEALYGETAALTVEGLPAGGVRAAVRLPLARAD